MSMPILLLYSIKKHSPVDCIRVTFSCNSIQNHLKIKNMLPKAMNRQTHNILYNTKLMKLNGWSASI